MATSSWGATVERLSANAPRLAVLTDFDGTLAPLVDDPAMSLPLPAALQALRRLAVVVDRVAVVSGRPAAFIVGALAPGGEGSQAGQRPAGAARPATSGPEIAVYGLYGLEKAVGGASVERAELPPDQARALEAVGALAERESLSRPGLLVERKAFSVVLHYRMAPEHETFVRRFATEHALENGLTAKPGKKSVEIAVPSTVDKGSVVADLARGFRGACFIGDDVGDVVGFRAMDRIGAAGTTTVKIAVGGSEAPEELVSSADLVLDGPPAVAGFLCDLAGACEGRPT